MTGKGHFLTGLTFSSSAFLFSKDVGAISWLSAVFCIIGVNAPDYLEIRIKGKTLIPHRTITHWIPIWVVLFFYSIFSQPLSYTLAIHAIIFSQLELFAPYRNS